MTINNQVIENLKNSLKALQVEIENNGGEFDSTSFDSFPFVIVHTQTCLFQSFEQRHVDVNNELSNEQWEAYIDENSNGFVQEAEDFKNETFANFI